ncbi:hypothetical protein TNCV_2281961 [Trichonephila clavipes]|nr:hypothetical protein TNCV_2281961 [Trichonephila clavipes]
MPHNHITCVLTISHPENSSTPALVELATLGLRSGHATSKPPNQHFSFVILNTFVYLNYSFLLPPRGRDSLGAKKWTRGRRVMSSSLVPMKTQRVGKRFTLNLPRAQITSRRCGVVVRIGGASSGVLLVT